MRLHLRGLKTFPFLAMLALFSLLAFTGLANAQVTAVSTFATGIQVAGDPAETPGQEFDDWAGIPLTLTDPEDNPSALNIIDIKEVQIANDNERLYIRVSFYNDRSLGAFLAFDTDQDTNTGFDVFGLGAVGSEISYVNDFVFDQRDKNAANPFNQNVNDKCCEGGFLDLNNGGAEMFPNFETQGTQREWAIPLNAMFSEVAPFGPTFPNPTFDFIVWTDQGNADVTDTITYTLATAPVVVGDYNGNGIVDAADYTVYRDTFGDIGAELAADGDNSGEVDPGDYTVWANNFGSTSSTATAVPEPAAIASFLTAMALVSVRRRLA